MLRALSAPCSTGEEAYSIAIWLLENWPLVDAYNIEIVGSDIDTHALDAAREGRYAARALARLPEKMLAAYFEPEHHHRVGDDEPEQDAREHEISAAHQPSHRSQEPRP